MSLIKHNGITVGVAASRLACAPEKPWNGHDVTTGDEAGPDDVIVSMGDGLMFVLGTAYDATDDCDLECALCAAEHAAEARGARVYFHTPGFAKPDRVPRLGPGNCSPMLPPDEWNGISDAREDVA